MSIVGSLTPMATISGSLSSVNAEITGKLSGTGGIAGQINVPERIDALQEERQSRSERPNGK